VAQDEAPRIGPVDVAELLARLGSFRDEIILIGGQALNLWSERFAPRCPALATPNTSKDIDFYGKPAQVSKCARLLDAPYKIYGPKDRTPCSGSVQHGAVQIDFVHTLAGVSASELKDLSPPLKSVRVMHPIHVLTTRLANVVELGRTDEHSLRQLRAAVLVVREFIRQEILERGEVKAARQLNEQAFDLSASANGLAAWHRHQIDAFEAVLVDPRLGASFVKIKYARMQADLAALREKT
jgi:hypothetical protein